ncbi:butyrate kinase [Candidatus Formimonas warabiya]|uniref:Probable butyrate kinase n=1 Tax=Formimonas warabiya TaxID=1761012 RepID=A0A3G1KZZ3_FORW1|nr:butyrate kinase [Candidatus Formimonas warabiya]ATW27977.1 butyrate kinase [Candidatus Formimonas warabiya]
MWKIFVINPGSTSTKIAVYGEGKSPLEETIRHKPGIIWTFPSVTDQLNYRLDMIRSWLRELGETIVSFSAVAVRGGLLKPLPGGTYLVNEPMLDDLVHNRYGEHASNLGALMGHDLVQGYAVPCYMVDPVVVDEMEPVARLSGHPLLPRKSIFHALNQRAIARKAARVLGKNYQDCRFVVAHLGGGISVAAHDQGRVVDVNNALDGEGPFSPERSGTLPAGQLVELCFSGKYSKQEVLRMVKGNGGVTAYLGTADLREVEVRSANGDSGAGQVLEAMVYQIIKEIGAYAAVLGGSIDAIVITGGIAYSSRLTDLIRAGVKAFAPVLIYPGEDENGALAEGVIRVLTGEEKARIYG